MFSYNIAVVPLFLVRFSEQNESGDTHGMTLPAGWVCWVGLARLAASRDSLAIEEGDGRADRHRQTPISCFALFSPHQVNGTTEKLHDIDPSQRKEGRKARQGATQLRYMVH